MKFHYEILSTLQRAKCDNPALPRLDDRSGGMGVEGPLGVVIWGVIRGLSCLYAQNFAFEGLNKVRLYAPEPPTYPPPLCMIPPLRGHGSPWGSNMGGGFI